MPNLGEIGGTLAIIQLAFGVPQGSVLGLLLFMVAHVIGQTIIFLPCDFYLSSSFFPRLISAVGDWMSTVLPHHRTTLSGYIFATKACIDSRKKTC